MNLYEAQNDLIHKIQLCVDEDGVIDMDSLEQIEANYNDKIVACGFVIKRLQAQIAGRKAEIEALTAPFKTAIERDDKNIERIKERLLQSMRETDTATCASQDDTLKVRFYKDRDESIEINDLEALLDDYVVTKRTADKKAIKAAIKDGKDVNGASLVVKDRLEIR